VRLAFSADWHIDAVPRSSRRVDPATGLPARLTDYLRTATWVAEEANRRGCEALIVAGDLSESRHPGPWLVDHILEALRAGPERAVVVRGNHDGSLGAHSIVGIIDAFPGWDGVDRPRVVRVGDVAICCIGHMDRHWLRAQPGFETVPDADIFRVLGETYLQIARGLFAEAMEGGAKRAILVGHQSLSGGAMSDAQEALLGDLSLVVDSAALAAIGYSAAIFGHFHRAQTVVDDPDCPVVYAGSIERVDAGEEREDKSFLVVDVPDEGPVTMERVPTPARRFLTVTGPGLEMGIEPDPDGAIVRVLDLSPEQDPAEVRRHLESLGAWEITEVRHARVDAPVAAGGLSETLTVEQALGAYFEADPDAEALVDRGRAVLAEVA